MDESFWFNLMALLKCFLNFSHVGCWPGLTQGLFLLELKKVAKKNCFIYFSISHFWSVYC